ncbi:hypothetical protein [Cupriavidus metallidurans]|uniref:hypothetical protein n=1 Tax=Cupriavidus metallidurans TaxID=119219 RepID=UPI001CCA8968|nr:hypothetical protein [Cupriavidus metallidurans]UBM12793.1 hypothetical protein LAI70_27965 [Cupriavidus metallidurans]
MSASTRKLALTPAEQDTFRRAAAELSDVESWPDAPMGDIAARYTGKQHGALFVLLVQLLFCLASYHLNHGSAQTHTLH